jgi:P27 family predicted phage terminase small subunit
MGGKGSGGKRPGAGRKAKQAALAAVHNSRKRGTRPDEPAVRAPVMSTEPPKSRPPSPPRYLSEEEREIWKMLAPHAHAQQTLTAETAMTFGDLCEAIVIRRKMAQQINEDGMMLLVYATDEQTGAQIATGDSKAHPLIARHQQQLVRVNDLRARFRLTPDGKERVSASSDAPKAESALARLQRQAQELRRPVGVQ